MAELMRFTDRITDPVSKRKVEKELKKTIHRCACTYTHVHIHKRIYFIHISLFSSKAV